MSLKKSALLLLSFLFLSLQSCNLEDDRVNFRFVPLPIISADLPESFDLNETYEIRVRYFRQSTCVFFEGFDVDKEDTTTRSVVAFGTEFYEDACEETVEEFESSFNFIVLYEGIYVFKFWTGVDENGNQQYLEIEVPVN